MVDSISSKSSADSLEASKAHSHSNARFASAKTASIPSSRIDPSQQTNIRASREVKLTEPNLIPANDALAQLKAEHEALIQNIIQKSDQSRRAGTTEYKEYLTILKILLGITKFIDKKYDVPTNISWTFPSSNTIASLKEYSRIHSKNYILHLLKAMVLAAQPDEHGFTRIHKDFSLNWIMQLDESAKAILDITTHKIDPTLRQLFKTHLNLEFGSHKDSNISNPFRFLHLCEFLNRTITKPNPSVLILGPGSNNQTGTSVSYQPLEIMASLEKPHLTVVDKNPEIIQTLHDMAHQSGWYDEYPIRLKTNSIESENSLDQYSGKLLEKLQHISGEDVKESINIIDADLLHTFNSNKTPECQLIFPENNYDVIVATKVLTYVISSILKQNKKMECSEKFFNFTESLLKSLKPNGIFIIDKNTDENGIGNIMNAFMRAYPIECSEITFNNSSSSFNEVNKISDFSSKEKLVCYRILDKK